jgi:hypothetical protein
MVAIRVVRRRIDVYLGSAPLRDGKTDALPLQAFLDRRYEGGDVIG